MVGTGRNSYLPSPMQRPERSLHSGKQYGDQDQEWTAARCHRLLRALTSRVAILTKDLSRIQKQNGTYLRTKTALKTEHDCLSKTAVEDEDWLKARKRVVRTYSTKARKPVQSEQSAISIGGRSSTNPGEVLLPTPVLARVRGERALLEASPVPKCVQIERTAVHVKRRKTCHRAAPIEGSFQLSGTLLDMRSTLNASRYSTYEGIYYGLESLLRTTMPSQDNSKGSKSRSLFTMALRAVPKHINHQESLLQDYLKKTGSRSAIENRDPAMEIYDELEAYGSCSNGWKQLRVIVRAHGTQVLEDAIVQGLFDIDFCGTLISLCIHMAAVEEGKTLLSSVLTSADLARPRSLNDQLPKTLSMLSNFTQHISQIPFQFSELSQLLLQRRLPLEWLATKGFGHFWTSLLQHLTQDNLNREPLKFLELSVSCLLSYSTTPSHGALSASMAPFNNTFISLLTAISTIILLRKEVQSSGSENGASSAGTRQLCQVLEACLESSQKSSVDVDHRYFLLLLATVVVRKEIKVDDDMVYLQDKLMGLLRRKEQQASRCAKAAMLICQIARCCGKGDHGYGFSQLQQIHLNLQTLAGETENCNEVKALIVDSSFAFAKKVPDRIHIEYAANMDATYCTRSTDVESELLELSEVDDEENHSGYRWEEGIGEWVIATPGAYKAKRLVTAAIYRDDDTPFKPPPNLRRNVEQTPLIATGPLLFSDVVDELEASDPSSSDLFIKPDLEQRHDCSQHTTVFQSETEDELVFSQTVLHGSDDKPGRRLIGCSGFRKSSYSKRTSSMESGHQPERLGDGSMDLDRNITRSLDEKDGATGQVYESFSDESVYSPDSSETASSPMPQLAPRRVICRTPRLTRKLFHGQAPTDNIFSSSPDPSDSSMPSSPSSLGNSSQFENRGYIERIPRLGRKALQTNQTWQMFEESDDELSFLSVSSCSSSHATILQELRNVSTRRESAKVVHATRKPDSGARRTTRKRPVFLLQMSESEDELCI